MKNFHTLVGLLVVSLFGVSAMVVNAAPVLQITSLSQRMSVPVFSAADSGGYISVYRATSTIMWTTNNSSTGVVRFGTTPEAVLGTASSTLASSTRVFTDGLNARRHNVSIPDLISHTPIVFTPQTYYYVVVTQDESGSTATSSLQQFVITTRGEKPYDVFAHLAATPWGITAKGSTVYVTDFNANGHLLALDRAGHVQTITSDLQWPTGVALDKTGFVVVESDNRLAHVAYDGVVTLLSTSTGLGVGNGPGSVLVDGDSYIIADWIHGSVSRILPNGNSVALASGLGLLSGIEKVGQNYVTVGIVGQTAHFYSIAQAGVVSEFASLNMPQYNPGSYAAFEKLPGGYVFKAQQTPLFFLSDSGQVVYQLPHVGALILGFVKFGNALLTADSGMGVIGKISLPIVPGF